MLPELRQILQCVSDRDDLSSLPPEVEMIFGAAIAKAKTSSVQTHQNQYLRNRQWVEREYQEESLNQQPTLPCSEEANSLPSPPE